jgi:hypothetical protein
VAADCIRQAKITRMDPSDILTKETILAALRRLDELLRGKGIIEEIVEEIRP